MRNVDDPKVRRLGEVALFQHCTPKELTRLAGITDQAVLETGQVLCRQGEVATAAFVIDDGEASVKVRTVPSLESTAPAMDGSLPPSSARIL